MALTDENGMNTTMLVSPYANGFNNGMQNGLGGDGWWIILLILLFAGGWGNGFGNNGSGGVGSEVQRGFDQSATMNAIAGLQNTTSNGFANAEVSGCNRAMDAMQTAYTNQIASMNQNFANQQNLDSNLNAINSSLQNCCCENRAGIADLKYTVATEACADRSAISEALRDVIEANTASTQKILDQMCQDKIDAKNDEISQLRQEVLYARGQASQVTQNSAIINGVYDRLNTCPVGTVPVYGEQPIFTCNNNSGCGCGCGNNL